MQSKETHDARECDGCKFQGKFSHEGIRFCDYIGITGHARPCPPGKDCTVRKVGKHEARKFVIS